MQKIQDDVTDDMETIILLPMLKREELTAQTYTTWRKLRFGT
jgi:hypothetical protein